MSSNVKDTPMMRQYNEIKEKHSDAFLFFRCGDFYEIFGNDAVEASRILDITLTRRQNIQMCGMPYHSVDVYISKMIKAGQKVAICEQVEDPKTAKGIVRREVTQIITPGTLTEEKLLSNKSNNFLLALNKEGLYIEIAYLDLSTGDFEVIELDFSRDLSILKGELVRIMPTEIIIPENVWAAHSSIREIFQERDNILVNRYPLWYFEEEESVSFAHKHFGVGSWDELGLRNLKTSMTTPGAVLRYVSENAKSLLSHVRTINYNNKNNSMILDESTVRNLELLRNQHDGTTKNSLLEILDQTSTSMGGRLLKKWIIEPLINIELINRRLDIVDFFCQNQDILHSLSGFIKNIMDLERLAARIVMDRATPKDLVSIKNSLIECEKVFELIEEVNVLKDLQGASTSLTELIKIIDEAIMNEPATFIHDGNIVKEGYLPELDELKMLNRQSKEYISNMEREIKERYSVPSLRIKYNKILGYFYEISKLQSKNIEEEGFILRQSLVNTKRYTNKELSEIESKILTAREEINRIEEDVFLKVKEEIFKTISKIQDNARIISQLDVLISFAQVSIKSRYKRPLMTEDYSIEIEEGRHPVVEQKLDYDEFIPNDSWLNDDYLMIITGPNMSGKSTYLRQNALIVLMAQIGCFVPAASARLGVVDRVFTRIGTGDNLARGQSTFLVEMIETANILNNATNKSLIIMDEIGRGTSTYDGLAIAWAILEYISNKKLLGAKTLFATHYHELTELERKEGIKNLSVAVSEEGDSFTFLHKIIEEPAEKSYGIHVAQLANLPEEIILYAEAVLDRLESKKDVTENRGSAPKKSNGEELQDLFSMEDIESNAVTSKTERKRKELTEQIKFLDINKITPLQSMNILADLQKKIIKLEK